MNQIPNSALRAMQNIHRKPFRRTGNPKSPLAPRVPMEIGRMLNDATFAEDDRVATEQVIGDERRLTIRIVDLT